MQARGSQVTAVQNGRIGWRSLLLFGLGLAPAALAQAPARKPSKPTMQVVREYVSGSCAKPGKLSHAAKACKGRTSCIVGLPAAVWTQPAGAPACEGRYEVFYRCLPGKRLWRVRVRKGARRFKLVCKDEGGAKEKALDKAIQQQGKTLRTAQVPLKTAVPKPDGLGALVSIEEIKKSYDADVAAGKALPGEKPPTELLPAEADAYRALIPDFQRYVVFMADTAFRARDLNPQAFQRDDVVEALQNYACRQIDRVLPGFARIVKVLIAVDVEEGDSPDAAIADDKLKKLQCDNAEFAAKNSGDCKLDGPAPPAEPLQKPKPIEVELCTITHRQLGATLAADMRKIVLMTNPGSKPMLDKLEPIDAVSEKPPAGGAAGGEIPENDAKLLENDYEFITRRLTGFYRWGGANRNFARSMKRSGGEIKNLAKEGEKSAPQSLKKELAEQKSAVPQRNARELMRRGVFQWTDAYEYLQMAGFIARGATHKSQRIADKYIPQEKKVLAAFWSDCAELVAICGEPRSEKERRHCRECAEKAMKAYCIAGKEESACKGDTAIKAHESASKIGLQVPESEYSTKGSKFPGGNTLWNWLALQLVEEGSNTTLHRGQNAKGQGIAKNLPRWVALTKFLGMKPSDASMTNEGKKYLDALPITSWQRCYLWRSKGDFDKGICDLHEDPQAKKEEPKGPACKEDSYWRNAGDPLRACPAGWEKQGALCYPNCRPGYKGDTSFCRKNCNPGYSDDRLTCRKNPDVQWKRKISIGIGTVPSLKTCPPDREYHAGLCYKRCRPGYRGELTLCKGGCPKGFDTHPITCHRWIPAKTIGRPRYDRGIGTVPSQGCPPDRQLREGLCYKRCPPGMVGKGVFCYDDRCPPGYRNDPFSCMRDAHIYGKETYTRDVSTLKCPSHQEQQGALCYNKCKPGYYGDLAQCKKKCPPPPPPPGVVTLRKTFEQNAWSEVPLFKAALEHAGVRTFFASAASVADKPRDDCKGGCNQTQKSNALLRERYENLIKEVTRDLQASADNEMGDAASGAGSVLVAIFGKILAMLINAAGMGEMMKTLAKAAGLTPEQSADCEDPEYRHETMKLKGDQDNKRGCLLKVFAKNFASVLESIIIMLGNKLVDWAVNLLRTALQGAKSALLASAGSVPFAGGFLATLVDIAWELVFNFGLKALLNNLIIANLPEWLQVRKLAKIPYEALIKNPIVAVILGIIVELIDAAVQTGKQNFLAMGFDVILTTIQQVLAAKKQYFWVRALAYAKKDMAQQGPKTGILEQIMSLVQALIGGFGEAVERGLDPEFRSKFKKAVDNMKSLFDASRFKDLGSLLKSNPVKFIVEEVLVKTLGPVIIPIITSFVKMPGWTKRMLNLLAHRIDEIPEMVRSKNVGGLVRVFVDVVDPALREGLDRIPFGSESLRKLIYDAYEGAVSSLEKIEDLKKNVLDKPWMLAIRVAGLARGFLVEQARTVFNSVGNAGEGDLAGRAVGALIDVVTDAGKIRSKILAGGPQTRDALVGLLIDVVGPYARSRFEQLAQGSGFEPVVSGILNAFLGPTSAPVQGAQFLAGLAGRLRAAAGGIVAQAKSLLTQLLADLQRMGAAAAKGALGKLLGQVVQPVADAVKQAGGLSAIFSGDPVASLRKLLPVVGRALLARITETAGGARRTLLATLREGILGFAADVAGGGLKTTGEALLAKAVDWVGDMVRGAIADAISYEPLRVLIAALVEGLGGLLKAPRQLLAALTNKAAAVKLIVPKVTAPFRSFLKAAVVAPVMSASVPGANIGAGVLEGLIDGVMDKLEQPDELKKVLDQIRTGNVKALFTTVIGSLMKKLMGGSAGWKGTIRDVVEKATGPMIDWLTGSFAK
jgi:hypothetical protein